MISQKIAYYNVPVMSPMPIFWVRVGKAALALTHDALRQPCQLC